MDEANIQQHIHALYEKNTSYPASTSEDYLVRRQLINDSIDKWGGYANAENIKWRQLYTTATIALTTATTYTLPANFIEFSSFFKSVGTGDTYYSYITPDNVLNQQRRDTSRPYFFVTGYPGNYVLNINPAPSLTGWTSSYSYYKTPTLMTTPTDISEIPKPYFIIYNVLSTLFEEERPDLSNKYLQMAADLMKAMGIENELSPALHTSEMPSLTTGVNNLVWGT